jgi:hypothetical protein
LLEEKKTALAEESSHTTEELVRNQNEQRSCEEKLVEIDEFRKGIVESLELEKAEIAKLLGRAYGCRGRDIATSPASSLKLSHAKPGIATRSTAAMNSFNDCSPKFSGWKTKPRELAINSTASASN